MRPPPVHVLSFNSPFFVSLSFSKKYTFFSDAPLDLKIKASMVADMFSLVGECTPKTVTSNNVRLIAGFLRWGSHSGGVVTFQSANLHLTHSTLDPSWKYSFYCLLLRKDKKKNASATIHEWVVYFHLHETPWGQCSSEWMMTKWVNEISDKWFVDKFWQDGSLVCISKLDLTWQ